MIKTSIMKWSTVIIVLLLFVSCKKDNKEAISEESQKEKTAFFKAYPEAQLSIGKLMRLDSFPSKYIKPRTVDVWLPENYSEDKKYAVLYMHDGQMLFDSTTTWNKQEWKVDEWAAKLMHEGKTRDFIVIAIWNIKELRNSNYFPEKVYNSMPQKNKDSLLSTGKKHHWINTINSDDYLKFLVKELKPFIDSSYATWSDRENTFVMGSSRGGLISLYAICEYPEIFGGAACLSTHWIGTYDNIDNSIPEKFFDYMDHNLPDNNTHKLYFDYGTKTLDEKYLPNQERVTQLLASKGYNTNLKFEGADHSENAWNQRLDIPLTFLLEKK